MFADIKDIIIYVLIFTGLYFQVFLLVSYLLWNGKTESGEIDEHAVGVYEPNVIIMVPCYNEEKTVVKTVRSLLDLDYPKEKLRIIVIDDGSRDGTWSVLKQFSDHASVTLLQKQNEGSKYAALNFSLKYIRENLNHQGIIGCLDADSRVHKSALKESLYEFTKPGVMAVVPSMVIDAPETFFQWMQKVEYEIGTYLKQVFSYLNTLYIAPGPFTLFKTEVFAVLKEYNEAHHVEDLEFAIRMQIHGMRLSYATKSMVYTRGPKTWNALLKQRMRWNSGFLKNAWDYKWMFFRNGYGHIAVTVPLLFLLFTLAVIAAPVIIIGFFAPLQQIVQQFLITSSLVGPRFFNDSFYINTKANTLLAIITMGFLVFTLMVGRRRLLRQNLLSFDLITLPIYPLFASWWAIRSAYSALAHKKTTWR